jgi:hypothetical protein
MDCFGSHCRYRSISSHLLAENTNRFDRDGTERTGSDHFRAGVTATCIDCTRDTASS